MLGEKQTNWACCSNLFVCFFLQNDAAVIPPSPFLTEHLMQAQPTGQEGEWRERFGASWSRQQDREETVGTGWVAGQEASRLGTGTIGFISIDYRARAKPAADKPFAHAKKTLPPPKCFNWFVRFFETKHEHGSVNWFREVQPPSTPFEIHKTPLQNTTKHHSLFESC